MMRKESLKEAKEAFAYTPGLKIKKTTEIIKERKLPLKGELLVNVGDNVSYDTIVAQAFIRGDPVAIDAASILKVEPHELLYYIIKKTGDLVKEGEIIANFKAFFGLINRSVTSSVEGTLETVSDATGQIIIRAKPVPVEVNAYIPGKVIEIIPNEGVRVRTQGCLIQGIFGIGGETHGELRVLNNSEKASITQNEISPDLKEKVLVGNADITIEALKKAVEVGVVGIIVGGIKEEVLNKFIGEEIGVAITGLENVGLTLIITEGFGDISMSKRTFSLLKEFDGYKISMNGATQIRAGVIRPEIIIPHSVNSNQKSDEIFISGGMVLGTTVRIIREPYFGAIGNVVGLPIDLKEVESGSFVRVMTVDLENEKQVTIPRANVEIIEE